MRCDTFCVSYVLLSAVVGSAGRVGSLRRGQRGSPCVIVGLCFLGPGVCVCVCGLTFI